MGHLHIAQTSSDLRIKARPYLTAAIMVERG